MLAPEMAHSTPSEQAQMTATMRDKRGEAGGASSSWEDFSYYFLHQFGDIMGEIAFKFL